MTAELLNGHPANEPEPEWGGLLDYAAAAGDLEMLAIAGPTTEEMAAERAARDAAALARAQAPELTGPVGGRRRHPPGGFLMAGPLERLYSTLDLDIDGFNRGLASAKKQTAGFAASFKRDAIAGLGISTRTACGHPRRPIRGRRLASVLPRGGLPSRNIGSAPGWAALQAGGAVRPGETQQHRPRRCPEGGAGASPLMPRPLLQSSSATVPAASWRPTRRGRRELTETRNTQEHEHLLAVLREAGTARQAVFDRMVERLPEIIMAGDPLWDDWDSADRLVEAASRALRAFLSARRTTWRPRTADASI